MTFDEFLTQLAQDYLNPAIQQDGTKNADPGNSRRLRTGKIRFVLLRN